MNIFEDLNVGGPAFLRNNLYVYGNIYGYTGITLPYSGQTGTYTATESDSVIEATSGSFTVTLPTAVGIQGRIYIIKNNGTGTVTVDANSSETLDGYLTIILHPTHSCITIQSNGSNWILIGAISPIQGA